MKHLFGCRVVAAVVLAGAPLFAQDAGAELLRRLSAAQVSLEVDGDLAAAQAELSKVEEVLRGLGAQAPASARRKLLELQVQLYLKEQKPAEASALLERAGADPALEYLRARVRASAGQADSASDSLRSIVASFVERNDWNRLQTLGPAAAEVLGEFILEGAGDFPVSEPLGTLLALDESQAVRFLSEHFDAGGVLWKQRILKALEDSRVLFNVGTWTLNEPYRLLEPELLALYARLIAVPETALGALRSLKILAERDAFSPELVNAIVRGLATQGGAIGSSTLALFEGDYVAVSAQPILEAALLLKDEQARQLAAEKLLNFERSEALLARASDPDPELRRKAAEVFWPREGKQVERGQFFAHRWTPALGERDVPLLSKLFTDSDEEVRAAAVFAIDSLEAPLEPAVIERLLQDPSVNVRKALAWRARLPEGTRPNLLARLAADSSPEVVQEVRRVLEQAAGMNQNMSAASSPLARDPAPYLAALEILWRDSRSPLSPRDRDWYASALIQSAAGLRALTAWTLAAHDQERLRVLVSQTSPNQWLALSDEHLARVLASLPTGNGDGNIQRLWEAVRTAQPPRGAALRLLFADASAPRTARLAAAKYAADASDSYREALLGFLRLPSWTTEPPGETERKDLSYVGSLLTTADGGIGLQVVLRDGKLSRELAQALLARYPLDAARSAELTQEVLVNWFKPELPVCDAVFRALEHLGSRPDLAPGSVLDDALVHPAYSYQALRSLAAQRNPANLPKIARGLTAEWAPTGEERSDIQQEAAEALASFNDPAAAEYLLIGLRSSNEHVREICKAGLERLEEYEKHARAWKDRGLTAPTRESALAELLTMLADKDAQLRAQAALGIATLGAVEALPELIRLLKDVDPGVRAAAQRALDRLNEAKTLPAGG